MAQYLGIAALDGIASHHDFPGPIPIVRPAAPPVDGEMAQTLAWNDLGKQLPGRP